jgi:hypothetical protein
MGTIILKQSTAYTWKAGPFVDDTDGKTAKTALTIAQADIRLTKNGGDYAQSHNAAGATHDEYGSYDVPLDTTDTNTVGHMRGMIQKAGALPVWQDFFVYPANVYDAMAGADLLDVNVSQISDDTDAANNCELMFDGAGYAGGTAKLQVDLVKILGTALTETAGQIAAGFKKLFDVATPVMSLDAAGMNVIADAVLVRNWASVTYTGTVRCALTALQAVRNKFTAATGAGGYSVKKENDSTESWSGTLSVDGDGNVTGMDPDN